MTSLQSDIKDISDISRLVNNARESPNFDLEKTLNLINTNDQEGLITSLITWVKEIFPLYSVPSYSEQNLIPVILEEINKTNSLTDPCICHIDDKNWHPPELPPIYYKCKTKTCGCICDKCVARPSYPCITCGIPFFCPRPCVCSGCKEFITNDLISKKKVL
jgi:hypothetical protein